MMIPDDYRLSAYASSMARQIMASQVAAAQATEHAGDEAEWARPTWLWTACLLLGRARAVRCRPQAPAVSPPPLAQPDPAAHMAVER